MIKTQTRMRIEMTFDVLVQHERVRPTQPVDGASAAPASDEGASRCNVI